MTMTPALRALPELSVEKFRADETNLCAHDGRHVRTIDEITHIQAGNLTRAKTMLAATAQFARSLSLSRNEKDPLRSMLIAVDTRIDHAERHGQLVRERTRGIMAEAERISAASGAHLSPREEAA